MLARKEMVVSEDLEFSDIGYQIELTETRNQYILRKESK